MRLALLVGMRDQRFIAAAQEKAARTGHFFLQVGPVWPNNATTLQAIDLMWPKPDIVLVEATDHLDDCLTFIRKLRDIPSFSPENFILPYSKNDLSGRWERLKGAGATRYIYTSTPDIRPALNWIFGHDPEKVAA